MTMQWPDPSQLPDSRRLEREAIARGLDPAFRHPSIDQAAAEVMVRRIAEQPHVENLFRCTWDPTAERITAARWVTRGAVTQVQYLAGDVEQGELAVHSHPTALVDGHLEPSDADLRGTVNSARRGVGEAIVSPDLRAFFLIRPPSLNKTLGTRLTTLLRWRRYTLYFCRQFPLIPSNLEEKNP